MGQIDFAFKHRGVREQIFTLLSDLHWHSWRTLHGFCNRYGARIHELRRLGWNIVDESDGEDGLRYRLASLQKGPPLPRLVRIYISEASAQHVARGEITEEARRAAELSLETFTARKGHS